MTNFTESEHPRSAGRFTEKAQSQPEVSLTSADVIKGARKDFIEARREAAGARRKLDEAGVIVARTLLVASFGKGHTVELTKAYDSSTYQLDRVTDEGRDDEGYEILWDRTNNGKNAISKEVDSILIEIGSDAAERSFRSVPSMVGRTLSFVL
jgi:hypothetical protein